MAIGVHGQRDLRVPHDRLNDLGVLASEGGTGSARVTKTVEVEALAFVIGGQKEVGRFSVRVL